MPRADDANGTLSSLDMLATAIAGRRLAVRRLLEPGASAFCDSRIIAVGARPDWEVVVAQAALVAAGSLDGTLMRRLIGRMRATRRYCALEVSRALAEARDRVPSAGVLLRSVALPSTASAQESLALALSSRSLPDTNAWFGMIRPLAIVRRAMAAGNPDDGSADAAKSPIAAAIGMHGDDTPQEDNILLKLLRNPFARRPTGESLLGALMGAGSTPGGDGAGDGAIGEMPVGRTARAFARGGGAVAVSIDSDEAAWPEIVIDHRLRFPEWHEALGRYRPNWVLGEVVDPETSDMSRLPFVLDRDITALARQLAPIGLEHGMVRGQPDGIEIDMDAMVDLAVEMATSDAAEVPRIYRTSRRVRRELSIAIALDVSGSTAEPDAENKMTFERQRDLAAALTAAFDRLGASVVAFAFQSWGRKLFRVLQLKARNQWWTSDVAERFGRLEPVGYTRLGAAIRHGVRLLDTEGHAINRVLLVLTDGILFDQDYELAYAVADARRAVMEARAAGIACIVVSQAPESGAASLLAIFGRDFVDAQTPPSATDGLVRVVRRAIRSSSVRGTAKYRPQ